MGSLTLQLEFGIDLLLALLLMRACKGKGKSKFTHIYYSILEKQIRRLGFLPVTQPSFLNGPPPPWARSDFCQDKESEREQSPWQAWHALLRRTFH